MKAAQDVVGMRKTGFRILFFEVGTTLSRDANLSANSGKYWNVQKLREIFLDSRMRCEPGRKMAQVRSDLTGKSIRL